MLQGLRFAAVPLIAGTMIALATSSVWAFTQQTVYPNANGNYNFDYGAADGSSKWSDGKNKSDSNSPGFHFSVEPGPQQSGPFGFRSFGDDNNASSSYFHAPLGGK